jgi:hypothetical protein
MNRLFWLGRRLWWKLVGRPAVRLYITRYRQQVVESSGVPLPGLEAPFRVFVERLRALLQLNPDREPPIVRECWIDTGAYLTIMPEHIWQLVAADIVWLQAPSGGTLPPWLTTAKVAGGPYSCRPGLLRLQVLDADGRCLPAEYVAALFTQDQGRMKTILLGLDGRVFTGRRLELVYDREEGWLTLR